MSKSSITTLSRSIHSVNWLIVERISLLIDSSICFLLSCIAFRIMFRCKSPFYPQHGFVRSGVGSPNKYGLQSLPDVNEHWWGLRGMQKSHHGQKFCICIRVCGSDVLVYHDGFQPLDTGVVLVQGHSLTISSHLVLFISMPSFTRRWITELSILLPLYILSFQKWLHTSFK